MKVIDALQKGKPTVSFEFFPPKTKEQETHLFGVIAELAQFNPNFVSVTYGALGKSREKTFYWVKEIRDKFGLEPVAHLTCVAASREDIAGQIEQLDKIGVENILALRGDASAGVFKHACELVSFIKTLKPSTCIGVAGYPEKHPESIDFKDDIEHLKVKVEAGADYIVTQLFFDNKYFFEFRERCHKAGIKVPVIPGIMPITSLKQIQKLTGICGATVPNGLLAELEMHKDDPAKIEEIGVRQAVLQCRELLDKNVPGIHFFVMNQAGPITRILKKLHPPSND